MRALFLATIFALGVTAAARAETVDEWKARARIAYPDLAVPTSALCKRFTELYLKARQANSPILRDPSWPMTLARQASEPADAKAPDPAPATPTAPAQPATPADPAPPDKATRFSLRPEYQSLGVKVRDQGQRGSCSIFGIMGALDFYSAKAGGPTQLSEQFVAWANRKITGTHTGRSGGFDPKPTLEGIGKYGVCSEELMPYKSTIGGNPSKAAIEDAAGRRSIFTTWIHDDTKGYGLDDREIAQIYSAIADGHPVTCGTRWPVSGWNKFEKTYTITNKAFPMAAPGHIVVLVGYEKGDEWEGGGRIEFRNSYSDRWGQAGYAWFSVDFLKKHSDEVFVVKNQP